ncbi:hypothetical protein [Bradyrhizobium oligotrophicum]|uniref:hypothetical protein n=1 Tax=Bradyrhizobium oligotrophicum TaxID=44255 RepID=UPI001360B0D5|nr:hypothetical protein [Bradyrhizobium oligotrophicum]
MIATLTGLGLLATGADAAFAVDLAFSPDCRTFSQINVTPPNTGITFRKNPNSTTTRAATATVFRIGDASNIIIPAGGASCFYAVAGNDSYCFLARSSSDIINVNAVAGTNTAAAPACQ